MPHDETQRGLVSHDGLDYSAHVDHGTSYGFKVDELTAKLTPPQAFLASP